MRPSLLIMAAGIGSRYGGIKQLDTFGPSGEKIIDYTIYDAIRCGFGKIVFIIRRDIEADFRRTVAEPWRGRIPMEFVHQELDAVPNGFRVPPERNKPWGTGHAILMAAPLIHGPFSVVNADDFYGRLSMKNVFDQLQTIKGSDTSTDASVDASEYCLVGYLLRNTLSEHGSVARGVCQVDANDYLTGMVETPGIIQEAGKIFYRDDSGSLCPMNGDTPVSMNLWGFKASFFKYLEEDFQLFLRERGQDPKAEFYLTTVIDRLLRSGQVRVKVLPTEQHWFGVTYKDDRPMVERNIRELVANGTYPRNLWKETP